MRLALEALCRWVLRIFFRRIEIVGEERLPSGGILLAPNHPSGLMDPLFVFTKADRPVSFLAKASLFDTFLVKHFIRAFDALPVYRAQDGHDTGKNQETLAQASSILGGGGAIAIFPEGKSHDEPMVSRLKTGAARIALGGRAHGAEDASVHVVPVGIFYVDKRTFRSDAALVYGAPIEVPRVELDEAGEPPHEAARALTEAIDAGLAEVVVQAESHRLLHLSALLSRLVRGARRDRGERPSLPALDGPETDGPLAREHRLRQRTIARHAELEASEPGRVEALVERMRELETLFAHHGLNPGSPARRAFPVGRALASLIALLALAPYALAGAALHYPVYRFVGALASRMSKGETAAIATLKMLGGLLFFPLFWLVAAVAAAVSAPRFFPEGLLAGAATLALLPAMAYLALRWFESLPRVGAWLRALRLRGSDAVATLSRERAELYDELIQINEED